MLSCDAVIDGCLALGPDVRYVAVYEDGLLRSGERLGLTDASVGGPTGTRSFS
jgi:hypothetical protein